MALEDFHLAYFGATGPVLSTSVRAPRSLVPLAIAETAIELRDGATGAGLECGSPEHVVYESLGAEEVGFEIAVPVDRPREVGSFAPGGGLPAGHAGTAMHTGPHESVLDELLVLRAWILGQGVTPAGAPCEFHWYRPPEDGYDSGWWQTQLVWFIEESLPLPAD